MESVSPFDEIKVVYEVIDKLVAHANNPRRHRSAQISQITASIKSFGFVVPILVDGHNRIIAGLSTPEGFSSGWPE